MIGFVVILFFVSSHSNPQIYKPNREWHFVVHFSNTSNIDTLRLKTSDEKWELTQKKIEYIHTEINSSTGGYAIHNGATGVIDRKEIILTRLFFPSEIWLHPPRTGNLRVTELLPFPWIKFPIKIGQFNKWQLTPKEGWREFEGKKITGNLKVANKILYKNSIINDSCWVIDGFGESEIGKYKCKYYFSEKYGFVYFFYDMNHYQIEIEPFFMKLL